MTFKNRKELVEKYITKEDEVLDVGFWGQAVKVDSKDWLHEVLIQNGKEVHGVDLVFDENKLEHPEWYQKGSAENFSFDRKFDVVFASELIEHLSNPGAFLACAANHLKEDGRLILTTPNAFNFMNIVLKFFNDEPPVNSDHTMYFNKVVLAKLLEKNGFEFEKVGYIASFPARSSIKRKILYTLYRALYILTPRFSEGLFVIATKTTSKMKDLD